MIKKIKNRSKIYIIGAGGHCRAVINVLKESASLNSIKIIDIGDHPDEKEISNIEVIRCKDIKDLEIKDINLFCAIGDNKKRLTILKEARELNYQTPNLISKSAAIDNTAKISNGNFIGNLVYIGPNSIIGKDCIINTSSVVEHETLISDGCASFSEESHSTALLDMSTIVHSITSEEASSI